MIPKAFYWDDLVIPLVRTSEDPNSKGKYRILDLFQLTQRTDLSK